MPTHLADSQLIRADRQSTFHIHHIAKAMKDDDNEIEDVLNCITPNRDLELEMAYVRIDVDMPEGPYISDKEFASYLKIDAKSLANRRAIEPERFPTPFKLGGSKRNLYSRSEVVMWLAREELGSRGRRVHRCI